MNVKRISGILIALCTTGLYAADSHEPWLSGNSPTISAETIQLQPIPSSGMVRVGLLHVKYTVAISATGPMAYTAGTGSKVYRVTKGAVLKVKANRSLVKVGGKSFKGTVRVVPLDPDTVLMLNGRRYRGEFILKSGTKGRLDVIEVLPLEDYLYGVLPREVGHEWPLESLKAQAVVSRTFVMANIGSYSARGYDVTNDVFSQVYGGLEDETAETTRAVNESKGDILVDSDGKPVQAFFHSSCGGHTEEPRYVWREAAGEEESFWVGVPDTFCKDEPPYYRRAEIKADLVRKLLKRKGFPVGTLKSISIAKRTPSGRAWILAVKSSGRKDVKIAGNRFRMALGADQVRSTFFTSIERKKNTFIFEGMGWGHGVGLCQWGARGRALDGQDYKQILKVYYPKAVLKHAASVK